ncbi:MAG: hypothetical protein F9K18_02235 [Thermoanaerobaculia bacterium]|nr:MAG: hypothetical protein F9K18_02235 [Thermoanaerobaculia bacterium]
MRPLAPVPVALAGSLLAAVLAAQVPQRLGPQTIANSTRVGHQDQAVAAVAANGNFVVVWRAEGQDGDGTAIVGRRFLGRTGQPLGPEFLVNVTTSGYQSNPALAMADDGRFVVVWESTDLTDSVGIFGSYRAPDGTPIVPEFPVNVTLAGNQLNPALAAQANGDFVVLWQSDNFAPNLGNEIMGRIFRIATGPGDEFQVNRISPGHQLLPAAAADRATGGWFTVWQGPEPSSGIPSIYYFELTPNGPPTVGTEVPLNLMTPGLRQHAAVAANEVGSAVAVWQAPDASGDGIFSRFIEGGVPIGQQAPVNLTVQGSQRQPAVALDDRGLFVTAWVHDLLGEVVEGSPIVVQGRKKSGTGALEVPPADGEFQISTSGENPADPWIAGQLTGNFLVAWQAEGVDDPQDPLGRAALFQRFSDAIFADDFETADTSRWSLASP